MSSDFSATALRTWRRTSASAVRLFHAYANWLVGITWKRFVVLSILLLILAGLLQELPPFRWTFKEDIEDSLPSRTPRVPAVPGALAPAGPDRADKSAARASDAADPDDVVISIGRNGVRITPHRGAPSASAGTNAANASAAASGAVPGASIHLSDDDGIEIALPSGATREAIRDAARQAREAARQAAAEARQEAADARRDAEEARRDAAEALAEAQRDVAEASAESRRYRRTRVVRWVESLPQLAFLFIVASAILKSTYKGRIQAEVKAAAATETAESEQLKRQVVEARMAAMQAQVEPHFLFNTLASIDHLIETDPPRASQMQKNLIALLRASMPTLRESQPNAHNLGREMAVIRPYLEILKVRMEDRLQTDIQVPDGLLSADFPSMMIQSLVENAIKHGLEPKAEGGRLSVRAEIVHGRLSVSVADTGLGFGRAPTAGTGIGLANIRERLKLLYGARAAMVITENSPSGTIVTLTVPYQVQPQDAGAGTAAAAA